MEKYGYFKQQELEVSAGHERGEEGESNSPPCNQLPFYSWLPFKNPGSPLSTCSALQLL